MAASYARRVLPLFFFCGGKHHGDNQSHPPACGKKLYGGIIHRPGDSVCEESGKDPGRKSGDGVRLQSGAGRRGVHVHERNIPGPHRTIPGKRRRDRLSHAAVIPARRDHPGGSEPAGPGACPAIHPWQ